MGRVMMDLTNMKFNMLTVLEPVGKTKAGNITWRCKCDCGNFSVVQGSMLKNGSVRSCGCQIIPGIKMAQTKHGMRNSRLYRTWINMRLRCYDPKHKSYKDYGGRGITVCEEWKNDFSSFYKWAQQSGYRDNLTLDRIDNNGNYEPNNCRWADLKTQGNNKRSNHYIRIGDETLTAAQWGEKVGLHPATILSRVRRGWSGEELIISV